MFRQRCIAFSVAGDGFTACAEELEETAKGRKTTKKTVDVIIKRNENQVRVIKSH